MSKSILIYYHRTFFIIVGFFKAANELKNIKEKTVEKPENMIVYLFFCIKTENLTLSQVNEVVNL